MSGIPRVSQGDSVVPAEDVKIPYIVVHDGIDHALLIFVVEQQNLFEVELPFEQVEEFIFLNSAA